MSSINTVEKPDKAVNVRLYITPQCFFRSLNTKRNSRFQFYIPGLINHPSYPKQKDFLKSYEGNLKQFNLSSLISTWTALDGARDTFWAKVCNRSFITLKEKSFGQKNFWNRCTGTKAPKWQSGYFLPNSHFGTFVPMPRFFWPNDFSLSFMKDLLHTFAQKVFQALSTDIHIPCTYSRW